MDPKPLPDGGRLIRSVLVLVAVFLLLRWAGAVDLLSGVTKPVVVALLGWVGFEAVDAGVALQIGSLRVPWTGDCAGLNILAMLLMVWLWASRDAPLSWRHLARLALAIPAAFVANLARIFTVIAYRAAFHPSVESAAAHYLFGFVWVLPVIPLLLPRGKGMRWIDILHVAATLALVTPLVGAPGGALASVCALAALVTSRWHGETRLSQGIAWAVAALPIALARMESLWLPWLLLCPFVAPWSLDWRLAVRVLLGAGTVVPLTLHAPVAFVAWAAAAVAVIDFVRTLRSAGTEEVLPAIPGARLMQVLVAAWFLFPFVAASVRVGEERRPPPAGVMARLIEVGAHEIAIPGVRPDFDLVWYEPQGDGRHHTLEVCMRFRGITLEPSGVEGVMSDGSHWYREVFLQDDVLSPDYRTYLRRTFWPLSDPGVHLIFSAPLASTSPERFLAETGEVALEVVELAGR